MVCLSEVVLNVVVLGWYSEFDEFSFKGATLLEQTMHLSDVFCFHVNIVI